MACIYVYMAGIYAGDTCMQLGSEHRNVLSRSVQKIIINTEHNLSGEGREEKWYK